MRALFRGLMVPVSFVLFLALFAATALAVLAVGPIGLEGLKPEDLKTLVPTGGGAPSPWAVAAGAALVSTLVIGMIAMLVSERVYTVWRFTRALFRTAIWFAVIAGGGVAAWLATRPGAPWPKFAPALLLAAGLLAAAIVSGILLGKPFLWWVSERPPQRRRRTTAYPAAPVEVMPMNTVPPPQPAPVADDEPTPAI